MLENDTGAAILTVNTTTNSTFSGTLGNGTSLTLVVNGGGSLTLSGNDALTGDAIIGDATLAVNGTLTASNVNVQNGGTLGGTARSTAR